MEPKEFAFEAGGVRLAGLEYGDRARRPLVLLHGIRDHAWSFDPVARALAREFRVIAPHLRGHGDSARPGSYAMADFVADLCRVVERLQLVRPALIGHSLGGQIAAHYAALFPEVPAALVCIEGLGPPRRGRDASPDERRAHLRRQVAELAEGPVEREPLSDLETATARFRARNPTLSPERARLLVQHGVEPHPGGGLRWKWQAEARMVWSTVAHGENEERWSWIRCPVLVVTASDSARYWSRMGLSAELGPRAIAEDLERKLRSFADVESAAIEGAGHMVHYDQPDALSRLLRDFLARRFAPE